MLLHHYRMLLYYHRMLLYRHRLLGFETTLSTVGVLTISVLNPGRDSLHSQVSSSIMNTLINC
jgi:hypothetical protein